MYSIRKRILLFCFLALFLINGYTIIGRESDIFQPQPIASSATLAVINIKYNSELSSFANNGNGSKNNPYVISGYNIDCSKHQADTGIVLEAITYYFALKNLNIQNCQSAIELNDVHHGIIINSTISNGWFGISVNHGADISVSNIYFNDVSNVGFYFDYAQNFSIQNINLNIQFIGFSFYNSSNGVLADTSSSNDQYYGYFLDNSNNINLTNNVAKLNTIGFNITNCSGINLNSNKALNSTQDGFRVLQSDSNNFSGNIANDNSNYGFNLTNSNQNNFINNSAIGNIKGAYNESYSIQNTFKNNSFNEYPINAQPVDYSNYFIILIELSLILVIPGFVFVKRNYENFKIGNKNTEKKITFKYYLQENLHWYNKKFKKKLKKKY